MPVNRLPEELEFEKFPSADGGRAWDVHYTGEIKKNKWVHIIGEAECGCIFDLDVNVEGGVTFRQAINKFASNIGFGLHNEKHQDLCLASLPAGIDEKPIYYDTTMRRIFEANP